MSSFDLSLSFNKNEPHAVYSQLKDCLRHEIECGRLKSMSKLPTIRELATAAGVSIGTMGRAVNELVEEGVCFRRPRIGIYVNRESAIAGHKVVIYLHCSRPGQTLDYASQVLRLQDGERYPFGKVQTHYISTKLMQSPAFQSELEEIKKMRPDCLVVNAENLTEGVVAWLSDLPFPVIFIGDFYFSQCPGVNQICEDTEQRGYELVRGAHQAGCRAIAMFGAMPGPHYVTLLRKGIDRAALDFGVKVEYCQLVGNGYEGLTREQLNNIKKLYLEKALHLHPDALVFEGHTEIDVLVEILKELGVAVGKDLKVISNRELLPDCIYIHPDYAMFQKAAAQIINDLMRKPRLHVGLNVLHDAVRYRLMTINAVQET